MSQEQPPTRSLGNSRLAVAVKRGAREIDDSIARFLRATGLRRRPSVLFEVYNPFGFDAQEPVIHRLAARGHVDVHVSGGAERGLAPHRLARLRDSGVLLHPLAATRHWRFDAVVLTDGRLVNCWRSSRFAFLHHGSGFGNRPTPYALEMLATDEANYLLALHLTEAREARAQFGPRMDDHIAVIGQPKLDRVVAGDYQSHDLLRSLGLDPDRRTVLFLSHWTPTSLMHTWADEVLAFLRDRTDLNVLVTGHHHLWDHPVRSGGVDWRARLAWIASTEHMRLFPQPEDLAALMHAADLAISDNTSGTLEYALLQRPIVLFRHPDFEFSEPALHDALGATADIFEHIDGFPAAFNRAIERGPIAPAPRRALIDFCFTNVGTSALHAAIAIEKIAHTGRVDLQASAAELAER